MDEGLPLDGVRVLELGTGIPAAFATRLLAGFGAEVVRVDGLGDGPPLTEAEEVYLLAGKQRVDRDLGVRALALAADIVVEDLPPGRLAALGLAPADLRAARPELVVVSVTPFGQTGPYRDFKATNLVSFAVGGIMSLTGDPARAPLVTGGSQAQYLGGLQAFAAAATTYLGAVLGGEGDWVDLSLQEAAAGILELYGPAAAYGEPVPRRMGNQTLAEWGIYPCADGWAGLFALQRQVKALFTAMDDPELLEPEWLDPLQRRARHEELQAKMYVFTTGHTQEEMMAIARERKVPIGVAVTPAHLLGSPVLEDRGFWDEVTTPDGTARVPGRLFTGLGWRSLDRLHAPGEDTEAVLASWEAT
jgi:crotonobetainyl-CoA:carnitine CoA-transferase CaiB-like acyl-CoA transferase